MLDFFEKNDYIFDKNYYNSRKIPKMAFKKYLSLLYDNGVKQDIRFIEMRNPYGLKCALNLNSGAEACGMG